MTPPAPRTIAGLEAFARLTSDPSRALIAMDFDGTLAPIVDDPAAARAQPEVPRLLQNLAPYVGQLAVLTGRPAEVAVAYGDLHAVEGLVVLGHYGGERWAGGNLTSLVGGAPLEPLRQRLEAFLDAVGAPAGTTVEDKGKALAVHVRRTADPSAAFELLAPRLHALAKEFGLHVEPGRLVLELRPTGPDKGAALRSLVSGGDPTSVVFIGDDLGDLPAFNEVERLRAEGVPGLLICSGSEEVTALAERADLVVDGPDGVVEWLSALLERLSAA